MLKSLNDIAYVYQLVYTIASMSRGKTQRIAHQYVVNEVMDLKSAHRETSYLGRIGLIAALASAAFILVICITTGQSVIDTLPYIGAVLFAGLPIALVALYMTLRHAMQRKQLRLTNFFIGKKEYSLQNDTVTDESNNVIPAQDMDMFDLFAVAGSLAYNEPAMTPSQGISAWEWYGTFAELPGMAIGFSKYGYGGQTYAFFYGSPKTLSAHAKNIWDLGHVRNLAAADKKRFTDTQHSWNHKGLHTMALAYVPLPAHTVMETISPKLLTKDLTILGIGAIQGTREYGHPFPLDPVGSLHAASRTSLSSTIGLLGLLVASYILELWLGIPLVLGLIQVVILKTLVESLPIAATAWDYYRPGRRSKVTHLLQKAVNVGALLALLVGVNYLFYFTRHGLAITDVATDSIAHTGAVALTFLTIGLCILADLILHRSNDKVLTRYQLYNPRFLLGCMTAILILLAGAYSTGPVALDDLWFSLVTVIVFVGLREIGRYADTHHSRSHILSLLSNEN